ncbi:I78 family peptidase inhibitor [Phaeovulum sp.]|uniref:I78 family peptidase inhibitor n=1 Tax=Phaeovulum sp. TaxID=2934796 RepID=UPI0039E2F92B
MRGCVAIALGLLLAACQPESPVSTPAPDTCGADVLQTLVGQPAKVLETMRFAAPVRIIRPDTAVTMDYRADRLNIVIDRSERIARVHCS